MILLNGKYITHTESKLLFACLNVTILEQLIYKKVFDMKIKTLITGAGRGIGQAIAEKFAEKGHDLYLLIRKKKK